MDDRKYWDKYEVTIWTYNWENLKIKYEWFWQLYIGNKVKWHLAVPWKIDKDRLLEIIGEFWKIPYIFKNIGSTTFSEKVNFKQTPKQLKQLEEYQERMRQIIMHSTSQN
jgi:hypothetical protein